MANKAVTTTDKGTDVQIYNPFGGVRDLGKGVICPPEEYVSLVWFTGVMGAARVTVDRETGEVSQEKVDFAGFFCDMSDPELNRAARAAKLDELVLDHEKEAKKHFVFSKDEEYYFILREIVPWEEEKLSNQRHGLARGSRYQRDKNTKEVLWHKTRKSYAYIMVFPASLVAQGYHKPLVICVNSTQTEDLLRVLANQFKVIRYATKVLKSMDVVMELPFHSYRIKVSPSKQPVKREGNDGSKKITIMEAPLPALTPEYLKDHEMPVEYKDLFEEHSNLSEKWSTDLVTSIANRDRAAEVARKKADEPDDHDPFLVDSDEG